MNKHHVFSSKSLKGFTQNIFLLGVVPVEWNELFFPKQVRACAFGFIVKPFTV
jgi:hypothetical protein